MPFVRSQSYPTRDLGTTLTEISAKIQACNAPLTLAATDAQWLSTRVSHRVIMGERELVPEPGESALDERFDQVYLRIRRTVVTIDSLRDDAERLLDEVLADEPVADTTLADEWRASTARLQETLQSFHQKFDLVLAILNRMEENLQAARQEEG